MIMGFWTRSDTDNPQFLKILRLQGKKKPEPPNSSRDSGLVPGTGLEPAQTCVY